MDTDLLHQVASDAVATALNDDVPLDDDPALEDALKEHLAFITTSFWAEVTHRRAEAGL